MRYQCLSGLLPSQLLAADHGKVSVIQGNLNVIFRLITRVLNLSFSISAISCFNTPLYETYFDSPYSNSLQE